MRPDVTAAEAICAVGLWCAHTGRTSEDGDPAGTLCPYYEQRSRALGSAARVTNYAMLLADPRVRARTGVLLADEAHRVKQAVSASAEIYLSRRTYGRFKLSLPQTPELQMWSEWGRAAFKALPAQHGGVGYGVTPDMGLNTARRQTFALASMKAKDQGNWLVVQEENGIRIQPIWGAPFVMKNLFGHEVAPGLADPLDGAQYRDRGVQKVLFTSATLMGAEYVADTLGLPDGSWAYLDLPSIFPVENRPINYAPVMRMNYKNSSTPQGRKPMIDAIDRVIESYVTSGQAQGVVHAVSNRLRDAILTESRWRAIMVSEANDHQDRVTAGQASVVVAANLSEGWDGIDDLVRFVIMPKVPFPSLGDERVKIRKEEDARSFEYAALVAVVQGAGRGVRHEKDHADTWILDRAWKFLYEKRKDWLPESFTDAYHHNVLLP